MCKKYQKQFDSKSLCLELCMLDFNPYNYNNQQKYFSINKYDGASLNVSFINEVWLSVCAVHDDPSLTKAGLVPKTSFCLQERKQNAQVNFTEQTLCLFHEQTSSDA